jgi:hypothetical protein
MQKCDRETWRPASETPRAHNGTENLADGAEMGGNFEARKKGKRVEIIK